jgi:hypothetical protein
MGERTRPFRTLITATILIAVAFPRLDAGAELSSSCAGSRFDGLQPLVADPTGDIAALWATSDAAGDLAASQMLYVRVEVIPGVPIHRLLLDVDGDRSTGMWTGQSHLSDGGWDRMVDPEFGVLYRFAAEHPDTWDWNSVSSPALTVERTATAYNFCIPLSELPSTDRVFMVAENSLNSMPRRFLKGASYPAIHDEVGSEAVRRPRRMAFYYSGSPWVVRGCTDPDPTQVECAARVFERFRHVVFGARLEEESRGGHEGAARLFHRLRNKSPSTELWGYMSFIGGQKDADGTRDDVYSVADYRARAKAWKAMGATGIFLDEYDVCDPSWQGWCRPGPDGEGVRLTRKRQVAVVEAIHSLGLAVFANSHSVQNALGVIEGRPSPLGGAEAGRPADMFLLENPTVVNGNFQEGLDLEAHQARFAQALRLTQQTGARLGVLDSMDGEVPDAAFRWKEYRVGWWQAAMAGADAYAFHSEGLAILRPPVDALPRAGLWFDTKGIRFSANGWELARGIEDCSGAPVGAIVRRRLNGAAGSEVGFVARSGASLGGCRPMPRRPARA